MDYYGYCESLHQRLKAKGYMGVEPAEPLDFAMMDNSSFMMGTKVVGVCHAYGYDNEPDDIYGRSKGWFKSLIGNNGAGLLIFVYDEAPAWAVDKIEGFGGEVFGATVDLFHNKSWIPSHLGWDRIIGD
jgi:hypothetical protein